MRRARRVVQLVPPGSGGVRDHAERLQLAWRTMGLGSEILTMSQADAAARPLAERLAGDDAALLVHFSGYGYQRRGLCHWLLHEVVASRERHGPRLRVVTFFHELYAAGPPWRSAFWLGGAQASIARRLALASDDAWTNSEHHAGWLRREAHGDVTVAPVFSNVGEPADVPPAAAREPRAVVFGSEATRRRVLSRLPRHRRALRALGIESLIEVGSGAKVAVQGIDHRFVGRLDESSLGRLLMTHTFALLDYPARHLAKSSVFAAYLAHGCVALNTAKPEPNEDGLSAGEHYVDLHSMPAGLDLDRVARAGRHWYAGHRLDLQAEALAAALRDS